MTYGVGSAPPHRRCRASPCHHRRVTADSHRYRPGGLAISASQPVAAGSLAHPRCGPPFRAECRDFALGEVGIGGKRRHRDAGADRHGRMQRDAMPFAFRQAAVQCDGDERARALVTRRSLRPWAPRQVAAIARRATCLPDAANTCTTWWARSTTPTPRPTAITPAGDQRVIRPGGSGMAGVLAQLAAVIRVEPEASCAS